MAVEAVSPPQAKEKPMAAKKKKKKTRPAKRTVKAAKKKAPARKAVKASKKAKTKKKAAPARKAAKKTKPAARKTVARKPASRKPSARLGAGRPPDKSRSAAADNDVKGEGNYSASRRFRKAETDFVKRNKAKIPEMGKEAEAALEGAEGNELRAAEDEARAHAHMPEE
jgi:hypothetical protein